MTGLWQKRNERALLFDSTCCILLIWTPSLLELKVSKRLLPDSEALESFAEPHPVVGALWISFYTIRHYDVPISSGQTAGPPDRALQEEDGFGFICLLSTDVSYCC